MALARYLGPCPVVSFICTAFAVSVAATGPVDFLDLKAGDKVSFEYRKLDSADFRSKLPYHFFDVPLPRDSSLRPITHFKVSINKKTSVLHSKTAELPVTEGDCPIERDRLLHLFMSKGFEMTSAGVISPGAHGMLAFQDQLLTVVCESSGSSPFLTLRIEVTTEEEHRKFEETMRNFRP